MNAKEKIRNVASNEAPTLGDSESSKLTPFSFDFGTKSSTFAKGDSQDTESAVNFKSGLKSQLNIKPSSLLGASLAVPGVSRTDEPSTLTEAFAPEVSPTPFVFEFGTKACTPNKPGGEAINDSFTFGSSSKFVCGKTAMVNEEDEASSSKIGSPISESVAVPAASDNNAGVNIIVGNGSDSSSNICDSKKDETESFVVVAAKEESFHDSSSVCYSETGSTSSDEEYNELISSMIADVSSQSSSSFEMAETPADDTSPSKSGFKAGQQSSPIESELEQSCFAGYPPLSSKAPTPYSSMTSKEPSASMDLYSPMSSVAPSPFLVKKSEAKVTVGKEKGTPKFADALLSTAKPFVFDLGAKTPTFAKSNDRSTYSPFLFRYGWTPPLKINSSTPLGSSLKMQGASINDNPSLLSNSKAVDKPPPPVRAPTPFVFEVGRKAYIPAKQDGEAINDSFTFGSSSKFVFGKTTGAKDEKGVTSPETDLPLSESIISPVENHNYAATSTIVGNGSDSSSSSVVGESEKKSIASSFNESCIRMTGDASLHDPDSSSLSKGKNIMSSVHSREPSFSSNGSGSGYVSRMVRFFEGAENQLCSLPSTNNNKTFPSAQIETNEDVDAFDISPPPKSSAGPSSFAEYPPMGANSPTSYSSLLASEGVFFSDGHPPMPMTAATPFEGVEMKQTHSSGDDLTSSSINLQANNSNVSEFKDVRRDPNTLKSQDSFHFDQLPTVKDKDTEGNKTKDVIIFGSVTGSSPLSFGDLILSSDANSSDFDKPFSGRSVVSSTFGSGGFKYFSNRKCDIDDVGSEDFFEKVSNSSIREGSVHLLNSEKTKSQQGASLIAEKTFDVFDESKSGVLPTSAFAPLLDALGVCTNGFDLEKALVEVDKNRTGSISRSSFCTWYAKAKLNKISNDVTLTPDAREYFTSDGPSSSSHKTEENAINRSISDRTSCSKLNESGESEVEKFDADAIIAGFKACSANVDSYITPTKALPFSLSTPVGRSPIVSEKKTARPCVACEAHICEGGKVFEASCKASIVSLRTEPNERKDNRL